MTLYILAEIDGWTMDMKSAAENDTDLRFIFTQPRESW